MSVFVLKGADFMRVLTSGALLGVPLDRLANHRGCGVVQLTSRLVTYHVVWSPPVFEMRGGSGGVKPPPHNCTGPWHLCFSRGPRVGP